MNRRHLILASVVSLLPQGRAFAAELPRIEVYRDPGCGCCEQWVEHLRAAGFDVTVSDDPGRRTRRAALGIADGFASCHTALIGPYAAEGHVPARDIMRLLAEQPAGAIKLAVPGMPIGSPGMEAGESADPYEVLVLFKDKPPRVFARYPA